MGNTFERIAAAQVEAMKARDENRLSTVRLIRAALKNLEIERRPAHGDKPLAEADVIGVLQKMKKQMMDSIEQFQQGGRADLVEREKSQLTVLEEFLPAAVPEADLVRMIDDAAKELGATSIKDMGKVVKAVLAKAEGRADGRLVSELVKKKLS